MLRAVKVAIDAHMIGQRETGNETYVVNLLRALASGWPDDDYQMLTPNVADLVSRLELPSTAGAVKVWPGWSPLRITLGIPAVAWRRRSDVLHMTTYVTPPLSTVPTVVTVHDVSYLVHPQFLSRRVRTILRTLVPISVRRSVRVIAVSEHTKKDLIRFYKTAADKIAVTPLAPGPAFVQMPQAARAQLPFGIVEPFVLAVGNLEPRKNLGRLLEAFLVVVRNGFQGQLVLAGKGAGAEGITTWSRRNGLEGRIVLTGFVTEADLVLLYNRAKLFAYPSLYEGFGLPPIEAMACGCPVVASNSSALPETLDSAALLVDPESVGALAEAMTAVLGQEALAASLRQKGMERAGSLSWHKTAALTRAVYVDAAKSRRAAPVFTA